MYKRQVSGHVDGTGRIVEVKKDDNAIWYTIHAAPQLMRYIVAVSYTHLFDPLHSDDNYEPTELMKEREAKAKPFKVWDKVSAARQIKRLASCLLYTSRL